MTFICRRNHSQWKIALSQRKRKKKTTIIKYFVKNSLENCHKDENVDEKILAFLLEGSRMN